MQLKELLYGSSFRRIIMRFVEVFVVTGIVGALQYGLDNALIPSMYTGLVLMFLKWMRELQE